MTPKEIILVLAFLMLAQGIILPQCISNCSVANCSQCSNTTCSNCSLGYSLVLNQCRLNNCSVPNCSFCDSLGNCLQCNDPYASFNSTHKTCTKACSISNCQLCMPLSSSCQQCASGYARYEWNGHCIPTPIANCEVAYDFGGQQFACLRCSIGFLPTKDQTQCMVKSNCSSVQGCTSCNASGCLSCRIGFSPNFDGTLCVANPCNVSNCLYCSPSSGSTCLRCSSLFVLANGGSSCSTAPCNLTNCLTCKPNSKYCDACQTGFVLNIWTNQCQTMPKSIANCQAFMFDSNNQARCVACGLELVPSFDRFSCVVNCPSECLNCTNITTCSLCIPGYSLLNGSCTINPCHSGCSLCTPNKTCIQCDAYSTLTINNTCISSCAIANCARCLNGSSFCQLCNDGFSVYSWSRKCIASPITHCIVAYDFSQQEFLCSSCSHGLVPTSDGLACVPMCSVANCLSCSNSTVCLACRPGFRFSANQTSCVLNSCLVSNCLLCSSNGTCTKCFSNFTLSNGSCVSLTCSLSNCQICKPNSINCDVCASNFLLNIWSGKCQQIPFAIASCNAVQKDSSNQYRCVQCSGTLIPSRDGFSCVSSCIGNCSSCANGMCFICLPGYSLIGSSCQINTCSTDCLLCDSTGACLTCKNSLFSYSSTTKSCVSTCTLPNCALCKSGSTFCQQCATGYSVYGWNGQCRPSLIANCLSVLDFRGNQYICGHCLKGYVPTQDQSHCLSANCSSFMYCQTCNSSVCLTCATGYSLNANNTVCTENPCAALNCLSCSTNGTCLRCASSFFLSSGQCLTSFCSLPYCSSCKQHSIFCDTCAQGYSWNVWTKQCEQSIIKNCDQMGAVSRSTFKCFVCPINLTCSQCSSLFISQNDTCSSICSVPHCLTCLTSSYCSACVSGYTISSNYLSCTIECSVSNCARCTSSNSICDKCSSGYKLLNNSCIADICSISNCLVCASSSSCLTCAPMTILSSQGQCQSVCVISNCKTCSSYITCAECDVGFLPVSPYACQPVCSISNCLLCRDAATCSSCANGYLLASNNTQCSLTCGIRNCAVCANLGTCSSCNPGYTLSIDDSGNDFCLFTSCPMGSYPSTTNSSQCLACSQVGCFSCSTTDICTSCLGNYYSSLNNSCALCSLSFSNCMTCNSARCMQCQLGYRLNQGTCVVTANCSAGCVSCPNGTCTQCSSSFFLNSNKSCVAKCSTGISNGSSCLCLPGLYMRSGTCLPCRDANCLTCDQILCQSCITGYYPLRDSCMACMDNCQSCKSAFICDRCMFGYSLSSGACVFNFIGGTTNIQCPLGCAECTRFKNVPICKSLNDGFVFGLNSSIIQCSPLCKACSPMNASLCTSCYRGMPYSGTCVPCSDTNCQDCTIDAFSCVNCNPGFTVKSGKCVACASNCVKCNINGAGLCDSNGCMRGYTSLSGRNLCVKCPNGCSTCKSGDFTTCLSCIEGSYLSSGVCMPCPSNCSTCFSTQVCSICFEGFALNSGLCIPVLDLPCAQSNSNSTCISCTSGYQLINSTCQIISSSVCTSNCSSCPFGFYLAGNVCSLCPAQSNCLQCDQQNPSICARCARGYFFNGTSCSSCDNNCLFCLGPQRCFLAKPGYFVKKDLSSGKQGTLKQCKSNCATCSDENHCTSCLAGWSLVGLDCVSSQSFNFSYVLKPTFMSWNESWSASQQQAAAFNNWPQIYSRIQELAGANNTEGDNGILIIRSIIYGSINITMTRIVAESEDPASVQSDLKTAASTGVSGLSIISSSITTSTATSADNSNSNNVYIGVFVGIGLLIIAIVFIAIFCVYRRKKIENSNEILKTQADNLAGKVQDPADNILMESTFKQKFESTNMRQDFNTTAKKLKSPSEAQFYPSEQIFKGTEEKERKAPSQRFAEQRERARRRSNNSNKLALAPFTLEVEVKNKQQSEQSDAILSGIRGLNVIDPSLAKMEPAEDDLQFQYVL